jgi:trans-aconitate 2-methyltransferase
MWNPTQYLKFADERSRPFFDLLAQVNRPACRFVVDLGCGTGHLTKTLLERWPTARVLGVDHSAEMLAQAEPLSEAGRLDFVRGEIESWSISEPVDLIVSNAALHWVGSHETLLPRLAAMLAPGGTLAVQMPNRFTTPSQVAIDEVTSDSRWASRLEGVGLHRESVKPVTWYAERLHDLGFAVNAWETDYVHVLKGENPVLEWLKGTGLRPLIEKLGDESSEFLRLLGERLRAVYPARNGVTLFPFPRLFFVAERRG